MDSLISPYSDSISDSSAVASLLQQLNVTRRMISLYPTEHPQIRTSVSQALNILNRLWEQNRVLTLGITPTTIYVNNDRIEQQDPVYREFARFFFHAGVATISFHKGLDAQELIRFHRLIQDEDDLTLRRETFTTLLEEQKVVNISVRLIDYSAFHEKPATAATGQGTDEQLWDDFLHRLLQDDIETTEYLESDQQEAIVALFNQKLSGTLTEQLQAAQGIGRMLTFGDSRRHPPTYLHTYDKKLNLLLEKLSPETRNDFLRKGLKHLEHHDRAKVPSALKRMSPSFLEALLTRSTSPESALSPRLLNLINSLATEIKPQTFPAVKNSSTTDIRTRVDLLFKEEQIDMYMPSGYQQALSSAVDVGLPGYPVEEDRSILNDLISSQSVEENTAWIIFERLEERPNAELASVYQNHLLNFSRKFLEAGNYAALFSTYQHWTKFINQSGNPIDLLAEKLKAYHTQSSFIAEVLDGFDLFEADRHQEIVDYIVLVGSPYCEPIVERLGLAHHYSERRRWIDLLTRISGNAQQSIIPFLTDERWYLVRNLVSVLSSEPTPAVLKAIQPLYRHPYPQVRAETISLLLSCNPATANRLLLNELKSDDRDARLVAVGISHLSRDPEVLSCLHYQLEQEPKSDAELSFIKAVVTALCRRGQKESLVILRRLLNRGGLLLHRRMRQLQHHIVAALTDFKHPAADKLLEELSAGKFRHDAAKVVAKRRELP